MAESQRDFSNDPAYLAWIESRKPTFHPCADCGTTTEHLGKRRPGIIIRCDPCYQSFRNNKLAERNDKILLRPPDISTGMLGAMCELIAAADIIARGHHVFRSMTPTGPCDLIALVHGKAIRIEVRSANETRNGSIRGNCETVHEVDVFAFVLPDHRVVYDPPLEGA